MATTKAVDEAQAQARDEAYRAVGAIASLGPKKPSQAALLLPLRYDDLTPRYSDHYEVPIGERVVMRLTVVAPPQIARGARVRLTVGLLDEAGHTFKASAFGGISALKEVLKVGSSVALQLRFRLFDGRPWGSIEGIVPPHWIGRLRPVYPEVPTRMTSEEVREKLLEWLPQAIPHTARFLEARLARGYGPIEGLLAALGAGGWTLEQLLLQAHVPHSARYAAFARDRLLRLATAGAFLKSREHLLPAERDAAPRWKLRTLRRRIATLPFEMTGEQVQAAQEIADRLGTGVRLSHVLIGDVASGKTCTFSVVAAALADAGARTSILLPNAALAAQIYQELSGFWPDIPMALLCGDMAEGSTATARITIGTTSLLHADALPLPDFVIVDEEQKFSVSQKDQLAGFEGHQLLVSATCIPRTLALSATGARSMSVLRAGHAMRSIETRLWEPHQKAELFHELRVAMRGRSFQLLVIYPLREAGDADDPRYSVEVAKRAWEELFPGRVRAITGDDTGEAKAEALRAMRAGEADVIVATTVAEVGINLAALRRVLIVGAERMGLTTLHQIRGRVARLGGEGWCDLLPAGPLSDKARERLQVLVEHADGFEVAARDLELRGYGDLGRQGTRQAGADQTFLFGQPAPPAMLRRLSPVLLPLLERAQAVNSAETPVI